MLEIQRKVITQAVLLIYKDKEERCDTSYYILVKALESCQHTCSYFISVYTFFILKQ